MIIDKQKVIVCKYFRILQESASKDTDIVNLHQNISKHTSKESNSNVNFCTVIINCKSVYLSQFYLAYHIQFCWIFQIYF